MSCGNPHETPCRDVLEAVYLYLDGEIDARHRALISQHLDECLPCLQEYGIEREVRVVVQQHCGGDLAPAALRARILARIRQF